MIKLTLPEVPLNYSSKQLIIVHESFSNNGISMGGEFSIIIIRIAPGVGLCDMCISVKLVFSVHTASMKLAFLIRDG